MDGIVDYDHDVDYLGIDSLEGLRSRWLVAVCSAVAVAVVVDFDICKVDKTGRLDLVRWQLERDANVDE